MATLPSDEEVIGRISDLSDEQILASLKQPSADWSDDDILSRLRDSTSLIKGIVEPEPGPGIPTRQDFNQPESVGVDPRLLRKTALQVEMDRERYGGFNADIAGNFGKPDTLETITARLGLAGGTGLGVMEQQAGAVLKGVPGLMSDVIPGARGLRQRLGQRLIERGQTREQAYRETGEGTGVRGGAVSQAAQEAGTMAVANAPSLAAAPFGLPVAATTAGLQSYGSTFNDATKAGMSEPAAQATAITSGLVTGLVTAGFGPTGIEALNRGITPRTVSGMLREFAKQMGLEAEEEAIDQAGQAIIQKLTYRPELTLEQAIKEVIIAGAAGASMAGLMRTGVETMGVARDLGQRVELDRQSRRLDAAVEEAGRTWVPPAQRGFEGGEKRAILGPPPENTGITVMGGEIPGQPKVVQVDFRNLQDPSQNVSLRPETARQRGYDIPEGFEALPPGQYSLETARTMLAQPDSIRAPIEPGPLSQGQGAAALGVPLQRPGVEIAPPQEPDPRQSFAEGVTPPGQRGRILTSTPASYSVDVTPPGSRGRQLETAPPTGPDRTPLPRAYPGLVQEAQATRRRTLPAEPQPNPSAEMLRAQLKTRMGESTVIGQPGFVPSTRQVTPPEDRPRKVGKMAERVRKKDDTKSKRRVQSPKQEGQTPVEEAAVQKQSAPAPAGNRILQGEEALINAATLQGGPDVTAVGVQAASNLTPAVAFSPQGYSTLDTPSRLYVLTRVRRAIQDDKIFRTIIPTFPVDVVNNLIGTQFTTKDLLHNKSMLVNLLASDHLPDVVAAIVDAVKRSPAFRAAEVADINAAGRPEVLSAAVSAGHLNTSEVPGMTHTAKSSRPAPPVSSRRVSADDLDAIEALIDEQQATPAPAKKPGKIASKIKKPKKEPVTMESLMANIAAKEAAAPKPAPTPAPVAPAPAPARPPRFDIGTTKVEPTEADVQPANDYTLKRAGWPMGTENAPTDKIRRQANLGYAMVQGKWQKVTGPIYTDIKQQVQSLNGKRLRQVAIIRDYAQKNNLTPTSTLDGPRIDLLLGTKGAADTTLGQWLTQIESQIKNTNAYLDGIGEQRKKAMSGMEGFIAGTKAEKWADATIAEGQKRLNVGLDPTMLGAYTIKGLALIERGVRYGADLASELINHFGETIRPHMDRIMENVQRLQSDETARNEALQLVKMRGASLLTAQLPQVQESVARIKAETAIRNQRGQKPVLTGEALDKQRAWDQVAAHPFIRKFFIKPVEQLTAQQISTDEAMQNYYDFKADPSSSPTDISGAAGMAVNQLDGFYNKYFALRNSYKTKLDQLKKKLEGAIEASAETRDESDVLNQLRQHLFDVGREMHAQERDRGGMIAYRKLIGNASAVRNTLGFIARHVNLSTLKEFTPEAVIAKINEDASAMLKDDWTIERLIGATPEVVQGVAKYIADSEPLRQRIQEGHDYLANLANTPPLSEFKTQLLRWVKEGNFYNALQLFMTGVGQTATEKAATAKAAKFFKTTERKTLIDIQALQQVMAMADQAAQAPEFRQLSAEAYGDLGVEEVVRKTDGSSIILSPIYDEEPTRLKFDNDGAIAQENIKAFKDYQERAITYLADPDHPDYDPRKAAGIKAFLDGYGQMLEPSLNPAAGKLVEGLPRAVFNNFFGYLAMTPGAALDRNTGPAANMALRTLNAYETALEQNAAIMQAHHQRLRKSQADAMQSHGITVGDVETYREKVLVPLAASMQYFDQTPLRVGSDTGTGYKITKEDINYYHELRAFERAVMNMVGGVGERAFKSIQMNPGKILYQVGDKTYVRMPHETGPGTVHRRLSSMRFWAKEWNNASTSDRKIELLNSEVDRLIFGYLNDVANPKYNFDYAYGPQLRSVLAGVRNGNPLGSFDDLVTRVKDKLDEDEEGEPQSSAEVAATILADFTRMFDRYNTFNRVRERGIDKSIIDAFGGETNFNTERGQQIVPSLWYDYGSTSIGERIGYLHNATVPFAIEHHRAVQELESALQQAERRFANQDQRTKGVASKSREMRDRGELFYSWGETRRAIRMVTKYRALLERALKYQTEASAVRAEMDPAQQAGTGISYIVASLLTGIGANITNTFGGGLNMVLFNRELRNQSTLGALASVGGKAVRTVARDLSHLIARDPVYKFLGDARVWPVVGSLATGVHDYLTRTRQLYERSKKIGINMNMDLINKLHSEWRWRKSGGLDTQAPDNVIQREVIKPLETMVRMATEIMKQGSIGYVDSRINMAGSDLAGDLEQDLMNRAIEFGEVREERARADGRDPFDLTDIRNRFSDSELVKGRLPAQSATRLREFLRNNASINIDKAMMDFYQRWVAAGKPQELPSDMTMFDEATRNQLHMAVSGYVNQALYGNRPARTRTGKGWAYLGLFQGYPAFQFYKEASMADRLSLQGPLKGNAQAIPLMLGTAVAAAVVGSLGVGLKEEAWRRLLNKRSPFTTIFDFKQTPKSYALSALSGGATMMPYVGGFVNAAIDRAYKTGYDLNSQFMLLNVATDVQRLAKEIWGSGEWIRPITRFATRWTAPMNWIGPRLPIQSGLTEVSYNRNTMASAARQIGLEARLKRPFSTGEITYTSSTGPLNDFMNAVGNGDMPGAQRAFQELVKVRQRERDPDPVMSAIRAVSARNPLTQVFGAKPTEQEMSQLLSVMRDDDRARVQNMMRLFDNAVQSVGGRAVQYFQGAQSRGGGGGGGAGGSAGYVPSFGGGGSAVAVPAAPSVRSSFGSSGAGGGYSVGPSSTFRIRTPRLRRTRLKSGRLGRRRGKIRSRLRSRRR